MPVDFPVDKYPSLTALEEHLGESAFRIRLLDRNSTLTVISPHGGFIEPGTSCLARTVAGRVYNLFDFQGLQQPGAFELHITSTRFRHPELTRLLAGSRIAMSIHSMGTAGASTIWLGGGNRRLKKMALDNLVAAGFHVEPESPYFRGESPKNIVNMCAEHGVQLELSRELKEELFVGARFSPATQPQKTARFHQLALALQLALRSYLRP